MSRDVLKAIGQAQPGIRKYLALMDMFGTVDVADNRTFQRAYNGFYRVKQRTPLWYETYYRFMEKGKGLAPTFSDTLDHLHQATGRYEPSFASKLVATLNPDRPVWDAHVLRNLGAKAPAYYSRTKIHDAKNCYAEIDNWYQSFLASAEGAEWLGLFDERVPQHDKLTNIKKLDFILWQMRDEGAH